MKLKTIDNRKKFATELKQILNTKFNYSFEETQYIRNYGKEPDSDEAVKLLKDTVLIDASLRIRITIDTSFITIESFNDRHCRKINSNYEMIPTMTNNKSELLCLTVCKTEKIYHTM